MQTDIKGAIGQSLDSLFIAGGIHRSEIAPDRADTLNVGTFNRFLRAAGFAPTAAMLQLKW
jgi:ribonucleotide monophosphatase NagD (HAD superfamily)